MREFLRVTCLHNDDFLDCGCFYNNHIPKPHFWNIRAQPVNSPCGILKLGLWACWICLLELSSSQRLASRVLVIEPQTSMATESHDLSIFPQQQATITSCAQGTLGLVCTHSFFALGRAVEGEVFHFILFFNFGECSLSHCLLELLKGYTVHFPFSL